MEKKISRWIQVFSAIQFVAYMLGFYNFAAYATEHKQLFSLDLTSLSGIYYWSILSMLCVLGVVMTIYVSANYKRKRNAGRVIALFSFLSPIIFCWFLIVPATLSLLTIFFIHVDEIENQRQ
ncbi:hypothetical protein FC40_GL000290 [Ligilactobacillus hayakitensis DSM 18933 = JCM 14209]|uniref:Uncharacterized protein n=1 Tax=Ligilactobacillus hayakitensis DSM 18933 = JCM 14209 TaxID=1423755 RepID=A0A0R1WNG4_9LACO|nr:hypothetical protein [Ligilactobacillus hayakitensis]KRM19310.1 hypothetical protein FC40_GL000290 [Ligilactobacillus hayakitensis DSM 18933 = JCM 14209]